MHPARSMRIAKATKAAETVRNELAIEGLTVSIRLSTKGVMVAPRLQPTSVIELAVVNADLGK